MMAKENLGILEFESKTPLYKQLQILLRTTILDGGFYLPGDILPSESQMIEMYGVSRATVRRAITELEQEGLVRREQGVGTIVCDPKLVHPLASATSFTNDIISKGGNPGSITLYAEEVIPDQQVRSILQLGTNETVIKLERIRLVNDVPVGIHISNISKKHISDIDTSQLRTRNFSLYDLLKRHGLQLGQAIETLEAALSNEKESQLLGVPRGSAVLKIERLIHLSNGDPFELCHMAYRGDRYKSVVKMAVDN